MAFLPSTVRSSFSKNVIGFGTRAAVVTPFSRLSRHRHQIDQVATLRCMRGEKYPYIKPYPYRKTRLGYFRNLPEITCGRLNEQSKIITVEGNIGVGKDAFAERLAQDFELYCRPGVKNKDLWVHRHTLFDMRDLNEAVHPDARHLDFKELFDATELMQGRIERMQGRVMEDKILNYALGTLHLLSTGQGFVGVRSPDADTVFVEAMHRLGWVTPGFAKWHKFIMPRMQWHMFRPHLVIYLHCPVDVCLEKIKKKQMDNPNYPGGRNLDRKFLQEIEDRYMRYLEGPVSRESEILKIDWSTDPSDSEWDEILETVEQADLEGEDNEAIKFQDWKFITGNSAGMRRLASANPEILLDQMYKEYPIYSHEYRHDATIRDDYRQIMHMHPMTRSVNNSMNTSLAELMLCPAGKTPPAYY